MFGEYPAYKVEVRANGALAYTRYQANGEHGLQVTSDPRVVFATFVGPLSDVVSENARPVSGEKFASIALTFPDTGHEYPKGSMTITVIRLPGEATVNESRNVVDMVVRTTDGTEIPYCTGYCSSS